MPAHEDAIRMLDALASEDDAFEKRIDPGEPLRYAVVQLLCLSHGLDPVTATDLLSSWASSRFSQPDGSAHLPVAESTDSEPTMPSPNDPEEAVTIGTELTDAGLHDEALALYMQARQEFSERDDANGMAWTDMEIAITAADLGWHSTALAAMERARSFYQTNGSIEERARVAQNFGNLLSKIGRRHEGLLQTAVALELWHQVGSDEGITDAIHNRANLQFRLSRYSAALAGFSESRYRYRALGNAKKTADADVAIADTLAYMGRYNAALEQGQHGLETYRELSLVMEIANAERVLSHALDHMADHSQAKARIENAIEIYRDSGQLIDEKNCIISLAYTFGYLGDFARAIDAVNQAHDISTENDLPWSLSWQEQFVDGLERGEVPAHEHPELTHTEEAVELSGRFTKAVALATELHGAQRRKTSSSEPLGPPYVSHLLGVAGLVIDTGGDEDEAIAALFHDAIEDTSTSAEDLQVLFGQRVANIVVGCSDANTIPKPPWRERKERHLEHLASADSSVLLVTAADKLWNLRTILRDLEYVGSGVWDRFNALPEDIAWYYASVAEVLTKRLPNPLTRELNSAVDELQQRLS